MTDREKIVSNDFYDVISDFQVSGVIQNEFPGAVYQPVSGGSESLTLTGRKQCPLVSAILFTLRFPSCMD